MDRLKADKPEHEARQMIPPVPERETPTAGVRFRMRSSGCSFPDLIFIPNIIKDDFDLDKELISKPAVRPFRG